VHGSSRRAFVSVSLASLAAIAGTPFAACSVRRRASYGEPWDDILSRMPSRLAALIESPEHEIQLLYTRVDRSPEKIVTLTRYPLKADRTRWFSAASWVKLPAVLLTAERMSELGARPGALIALEAPPATGDWPAGEPLSEPFARTVRRVFTVSENGPFNRLYEYLGPTGFSDGFAEHGFGEARIVGRLGSPSVDANRSVGAVLVVDGSGVVLDRRSARSAETLEPFPYGQVLKGRGWRTSEGTLEAGPHDFSATNSLPLEDMHDMLTGLVFPDAEPAEQTWRITPAMRTLILTELARWPRESSEPKYDETTYYDGYSKYFIVGDSRSRQPDGLRLFSKSGQAYGYLNDCAYVVDRRSGVDFFLAATIHANADGIYNDDQYEYEGIGLPFLAELGRAVLEHERARPRTMRATFDHLPEF
jgi:hypothetical protein